MSSSTSTDARYTELLLERETGTDDDGVGETSRAGALSRVITKQRLTAFFYIFFTVMSVMYIAFHIHEYMEEVKDPPTVVKVEKTAHQHTPVMEFNLYDTYTDECVLGVIRNGDEENVEYEDCWNILANPSNDPSTYILNLTPEYNELMYDGNFSETEVKNSQIGPYCTRSGTEGCVMGVEIFFICFQNCQNNPANPIVEVTFAIPPEISEDRDLTKDEYLEHHSSLLYSFASKLTVAFFAVDRYELKNDYYHDFRFSQYVNDIPPEALIVDNRTAAGTSGFRIFWRQNDLFVTFGEAQKPSQATLVVLMVTVAFGMYYFWNNSRNIFHK